jgi:hypothetical protein
MLIFYSCIAGQGAEGSLLLTSLSTHLPSRTIVAFEVFGLIGRLPNTPGAMEATTTSSPELASRPGGTIGRLSPWSRFAKWAKSGKIVRLPILEQNGRPGRRCANPSCPGHAAAGDRCPGW